MVGQAEVVGNGRGLSPPMHAQLGQNVRHVDAGGLLGDKELVGDLPVRPAGRDQFQHFALPRRKPKRLERVRDRAGLGRLDAKIQPSTQGEPFDLPAKRRCIEVDRDCMSLAQGSGGRRRGAAAFARMASAWRQSA